MCFDNGVWGGEVCLGQAAWVYRLDQLRLLEPEEWNKLSVEKLIEVILAKD